MFLMPHVPSNRLETRMLRVAGLVANSSTDKAKSVLVIAVVYLNHPRRAGGQLRFTALSFKQTSYLVAWCCPGWANASLQD
jgi:hypothetical protein